MSEVLEGKVSKEDRISELENKISAVCIRMRCPRVKWYLGWFECRVGRCHCPSRRVTRWLDEIKRLEGVGHG